MLKKSQKRIITHISCGGSVQNNIKVLIFRFSDFSISKLYHRELSFGDNLVLITFEIRSKIFFAFKFSAFAGNVFLLVLFDSYPCQ